jgi:hypothetical protein
MMLLLFAAKLLGQSGSYFNRQYDLHPSGESSSGVVVVNGDYYVCGSGAVASGDVNIDLSCIDNSGNLLWTKTYGQASFRFYCGIAGSLIATNDGGFALGGTIQSADTTIALLMKFDINGDTLWTKTFGNDSACYAYQCKQTRDLGYILVGGTDFTDYWGDLLLIKTDSLGNEQWRITYGNNNQEIGLSVVQTFDGGYLVGGGYQQIGGDEDEYVVKFDSIGNFEWQRYLGGLYDDGNAFVVQLADSNYAIGGTLTINQPGGPGVGNPYGKPNIVKLDQNGATIWNNTYGVVNFNTTITSLTELPDGSLIGAGFFGGITTMEGFVLKTDSSGDSLFLRPYNYYWNNHDYFYDIKPTADNGFIISGCTLDSQGNTWLVKTDSLGCDTVGCNMTSIVFISHATANVTIFPNPSNGTISVEFPAFPVDGYQIVIYDVLGSLVYTSNLFLSESAQLNVPQTSGCYLLQIQSKEGAILHNETILRE